MKNEALYSRLCGIFEIMLSRCNLESCDNELEHNCCSHAAVRSRWRTLSGPKGRVHKSQVKERMVKKEVGNLWC